MFMRSERLFLRPAWPEDRDEILQATACGMLADAILRGCAPGWVQSHFLITVPTMAAPASVIGVIAINAPDLWIAPAHRSQGYAREAAHAVRRTAEMLGYGDDDDDNAGMKRAA